MRRKLVCLIWIAVFSAKLSGVVYAQSRPVTVFAAASLATVLSEVADMAARTGLPRCRCIFAASSLLARQITDGAPSDIFVSANRYWVNHVAKAGFMDGETQQIIARNRLVLISHADVDLPHLTWNWENLPDLLDGRWFAMADPDHVPAGMYGAAALKYLGVWDRLTPRIARAANVRAALALVDRGEAVAGIVYSSDIGISKRVKVVASVPSTSHPPIEYAAVVSKMPEGESVDAYYAFLLSADVQARFAAHGFLPADGF